VAEAITRMLAEPMPDGGALVLSHNDVNPSNILFDGARVVLLDWDLAGPSNRDYDFATIAVFLRMDDAASATLVGGPLSPRFHYDRRLVAVACGTIFLHIAHAAGHAGDATDDGELLEAAYLRMREGAIDVGSPTGQWAFGLALLRQSARL
jgi:aminoglycoside phosphotransferase (APT) family kinase protein